MTFSHDDIRERLIDFLYGELDAEARAAFTTHVEGCEVCRVEVSGAEQARAIGRTVARAPLSDEVPSRVRTAALAAARAAAKGRETTAAPANPARAAAAPEPSWFDRLRRRWTFPTFATVAAMAAFLLVRATIFREAKRPLSEQTPSELRQKEAPPSPPSVPVPVAAPEAQASAAFEGSAKQAAEQPKAARPSSRVSGHRKSVAAPTGGGADSSNDEDDTFARRPAFDGLGAMGSGAAQERDSMGGHLERRRISPASAKPAIAEEKDVEKDEAPSRGAAITKGGRAEGGEAKKIAAEPRAPVVQREFAAPPPPAPARVAAPMADDRAAVEDSASVAASPAGKRADAVNRLAAPAPALSAPAANRAAAPAAEVERSGPAKKSKARDDDAAGADADVGPSDGDPTSALVIRAEKLMTAHRWTAAATAYRELLRRFPKHPATPTWRSRLATAQAAATAEEHQIIR